MLEVQEIKNKIYSYIKENFLFGYKDDELLDDTSFFRIGVLDSTGIMELVAFIEREFKVSVLDEEIIQENLDSINLITKFLLKKLS